MTCHSYQLGHSDKLIWQPSHRIHSLPVWHPERTTKTRSTTLLPDPVDPQRTREHQGIGNLIPEPAVRRTSLGGICSAPYENPRALAEPDRPSLLSARDSRRQQGNRRTMFAFLVNGRGRSSQSPLRPTNRQTMSFQECFRT